LYFSVSDIELRKQLILKDREAGDIALLFWRQDLADAAGRLEAARLAHQHWWVWAAVWAVIITGLGFNFLGLIGALGGLLIGYFNGRHLEHDAIRVREIAVADAEQELSEAKGNWDRVRNEPQIFSKREAQTGQPDPRVTA
jgi:hypothetical protein